MTVMETKFKRVRKGKYESDNGYTIQRHFYGGEKAWYILKDTEVVAKQYTLDNAKKWIERYT